MPSSIDYIFMKLLDKCVVIIMNVLSSSRISIELIMTNIFLAPRWFVLSSTTLLPSLWHKLIHVLCCTLSSLLFSFCCFLPWSITIFDVKDVVRIAPPIISWNSNTSRHLCSFLGPRVVSTRNTDNWTMMCEYETSGSPNCFIVNGR